MPPQSERPTALQGPPQEAFGPRDIVASLEALRLPFEVFDHPAYFTVADGAADKARIPGASTKNLFLADKSGRIVLVCVRGDLKAPVNRLHPAFGTQRLSFASTAIMYDLLGVVPGAVTPFGLIKAPPGSLQIAFDTALLTADLVGFHPLVNTQTLVLAPRDLIFWVRQQGHAPFAIDFDKHDAGAPIARQPVDDYLAA